MQLQHEVAQCYLSWESTLRGRHMATIWCGLYVYANYFYNDKQIDVENFYIAELPLPPSQFEEDFKEIHQIVMENYSLYQAKHLNMDRCV